ncbi:MAG TPA: response regulator [Aliidongia sp.]|nr:response regulator [Aliidongia sp.]
MEPRSIDAPEILIIEDEPLIAMYIEDALARSGYRTAGPCETVASAVEAAQRFEGAGALVDLMLDGGDASVVAEILTQRNIPFAIMTGREETAHVASGIGTPVLKKPFLAGDLLETVRVVCTR